MFQMISFEKEIPLQESQAGQVSQTPCPIWACAKTPLAQFDRKGDHLIRTPMHARFIPDSHPMHAADAVRSCFT